MPMVLIHMGDAVNINCDCSLAGSYECSNMDNSCYLSANYLKGKDKPNYPVPAHRYAIKKDYMNDRLIGLMLGATNIGLLVYWPLGYNPIETV